MLRFLCGLFVVSAALVGCSDSGSRLGSVAPVKTPKWGALDKFDSMDVLYPVTIAAQAKNWDGVKDAVARAEFKTALDEFANSEIPGEFATAARKQAKDDVVKNFRAAMNAADTNELKTAYEAAAASLAELRKPAGGGSTGSQ